MNSFKKFVNIKKTTCHTNSEILTLKKALQNSLTVNHTGKMENMASVSTSCLLNPYCQKRRRDRTTICSHCYAAALLSRPTNKRKFKRNISLWCREIIPAAAMPEINSLFFRFESFGDLLNEIQLINYIRFAKKNSLVNTALWSKNMFVADHVFSNGLETKPGNMQFIESGLKLDEQIKPTYKFVDKVFIVNTGKKAIENGVKINCGGRSCFECGKCYKPSGATVINELLKSDQKKAAYKTLMEV